MMQQRAQGERGFTLVELMIVVAVVAILAAVAYPSYVEYVARGHRRELQTNLAAAQQWLERFYSERYTYPTAAPQLPTGLTTSPQSSASPKYHVSVSVATDRQSYVLTATRAGSMASDACGDPSVNNLGEKTAANFASGKYSSANDAVAACWR